MAAERLEAGRAFREGGERRDMGDAVPARSGNRHEPRAPAFAVVHRLSGSALRGGGNLRKHHRVRAALQTAVQEKGGMKGTLTVLVMFALGCIAGALGILPQSLADGGLAKIVLYLLMFLVGVNIGGNPDLKKIFGSVDPKLLLLPLASIFGTLAVTALVSLVLPGWGLADCLAVGSGMGYYSLSSILISEYRQMALGAQLAAELGTIALLSNVFRELFTLVASPFLAKKFGPFAPIASAGATAMDVSLPVILRSSGDSFLAAAVISGVICDFSVPLLVSFFCSL